MKQSLHSTHNSHNGFANQHEEYGRGGYRKI